MRANGTTNLDDNSAAMTLPEVMACELAYLRRVDKTGEPIEAPGDLIADCEALILGFNSHLEDAMQHSQRTSAGMSLAEHETRLAAFQELRQIATRTHSRLRALLIASGRQSVS